MAAVPPRSPGLSLRRAAALHRAAALRRAAALFLALGIAAPLTGCGPAAPSPLWTGAGSGSGTGTSAATSPAGGAAGTSASPSPSSAATGAAWKTYADPDRTLSFELPADWLVQSAEPAAGSPAGARRIELKKGDGTFVAALETGLAMPSAQACDASAAKPYTVLASVPVDMPFVDGPDVISPRFVFRVLQGQRFIGSFGLVGVPTLAQDGRACRLLNIVPGPPGIGGYSFSDATQVAVPAAGARVAPLKSFDSLAQASAYVRDSGEFADAQRMIMSLSFTARN